jgi:hypothetical protein
MHEFGRVISLALYLSVTCTRFWCKISEIGLYYAQPKQEVDTGNKKPDAATGSGIEKNKARSTIAIRSS